MNKFLPQLQTIIFTSQPLRALRTTFIFLIAVFIMACGGVDNTSVSKESTLANKISRLVVTEVYVDTELGALIVNGHNFDSATPLVYLDDQELDVSGYTSTRITADLPGWEGLSGEYLVTVATADDQSSFDTLILTVGDSEPATDSTQLHIRSVLFVINAEDGVIGASIDGINFDNGDWPPVVMLNDTQMDVDENASDATGIFATTPTQGAVLNEETLVSVNTGEALENFDIIAPLANQFVIPPYTGEEVCEFGICWKEGPLCRHGLDWLDVFDWVPCYFELTRDYQLKLSHFYRAEGEGLRLPRRAKRNDRDHDEYYALMGALPLVSFDDHTDRGYKWDFVSITRDDFGLGAVFPTIHIKKGYRWDGESINPVSPYHRMRAAFIHDVMYDLIRFNTIPWKDSFTNRYNDRDNNNNRELADMLLYWIALEDKAYYQELTGRNEWWVNTDGAYYTLQQWGWKRAKMEIEEDASWRFHTMASALLSSAEHETETDVEGNKIFNMSCVENEDIITFDGKSSRPFTLMPKSYDVYPDLHKITWQWSAYNLDSLATRIFDDDSALFEISVKDLMQGADLLNATVTLTTDKDVIRDPHGDKGDELDFSDSDEIEILVEYDTEPPVITGIS
ncbi:MAG: hypothetical protein KAU21_18820, partial [Gammaproteobacteria bacterium]|nr:hypothetical protein [Gammaproteobacteria bacterium]